MKSKWKEVLCFFVVRLILVKCDYFSIVGSAILRVDEPYRVAVTSHYSYGEELELNVGIVGVTNQGESVEVFQDVSIESGSTKILKFRFPNLSLGKYQLQAKSHNFSKSVGIYVNSQKVTLMIQMDKPLYKTTDIVKFRIFALTSRTKPYEAAVNRKIWILDPRHNELKTWENIEFSMGVFESQFDFTRLRPGMYEILAEVDGTITSKKFEIFKKTQQIYELKLSVPERVSFRDGFLKAKISIHLASKYALENLHSISGKLVLTCDEMRVVKYQKIINTTNYEVFENVDFINDLGLEFMDDRRTYNIRAVFTDDITKKNFTASAAFTIEMSDYQIQIVHSPKYFKIGIPYSFTLLVTNAVDEYPVINSIEPIYVVVKDDNNESLVDDDFQLDPNTGSVEIHTPEIPEDTLFLNIFAKYDKIQYIQRVNLSATQRSESISIDVLTARPKMYEEVDIELDTTSKSTPFAIFQVFAKGMLKMSKLIPLKRGYANFTILPKFSYTPKAHCIAYFITDDGEIISDTLVLNFNNQFPNFVHLEVNSTDSVNPGSSFYLNVTSTLYSSVSLLAIDQRGISQRFKHDILKDYVFDNELIKYDRAAIENFYDFDIPFWFYPLSYQKTFFEIGAVILTNAIQEVPCKPNNTELNVFDKFEVDPDQIASLDVTKSDDVKRYTDGFLFKTIQIESSTDEEGIIGEEFVLFELPNSSTSWTFTAITLHNKYGLGMTTEPFVLDSYKKFFVDFSVPAFLKIGEIFLVEILIGNLHDVDISATVQVFNYQHQGFKISRPWTYEWIEAENGVLQNIDIPTVNVHRLLIEVTAESFGSFEIEVEASCGKGIDKKSAVINIIPEGFLTQSKDTSIIVTEDCYSNVFRTLRCNLTEENIIEDTFDVHATVVGDIMGVTLTNLDGLFKQPAGNAEEILSMFALNILALDYLVITDQISEPLETKAVYYLTQSFQKLIRYRNIDGSFGTFIDDNSDGSVLLTANVYRYMLKAQRYIKINKEFFSEALIFIASKQELSGKFAADQKNSFNMTQTDVVLTAFFGTLFHENIKAFPQYMSVVQKAVEYVELHYDKSNLYSLALVTYFMYEIDSPLKSQLLQSLMHHIQKVSSIDVYWKGLDANKVTSMDVEINSYCLMILDHIPELYAEAFNIVQWLLIQQNSNGKFFSTQDTIIATEAISRFASRLSGMKESLEIELTPNGDEENVQYASISGPLKLVTQKFQLPPTTRQLDISAHGDGFAIIQLSCSYYVYSIQTSSSIKLSAQFQQGSCNDYLVLTIALELSLSSISDILVVSIESPSGFVYDALDSALPSFIVNIEELNMGTLLHIYLRHFKSKVEFDLAFLRKFIIFNASFSNIEVYDFNNEIIKSSIFYKASKDLPLCSNQTLSTSPPIYEVTTLEPLSTDFSRMRSTTELIEIVDDITETPDNVNEFEDISTIEEEEEGVDSTVESFEDYETAASVEEEMETESSSEESLGNDSALSDTETVTDVEQDDVQSENEILEDESFSGTTESDENLSEDEETESTIEDSIIENDESIQPVYKNSNDIDYIEDEVGGSDVDEIEEGTNTEGSNTTESEESGASEVFPQDDSDDVDSGITENSMSEEIITDNTTIETEVEELTTEEPQNLTEAIEETTKSTANSKQSFKKKRKPKAMPTSFKNKKKLSSKPRVPKITSKNKKIPKKSTQ